MFRYFENIGIKHGGLDETANSIKLTKDVDHCKAHNS